ncbi:TPA: KTSC domain-containing protein [Yersinia enterocolitica]
MIRQPVSSSNLHSVGYDSASSTLEIAFLGGGVYQYSKVPASVHASLMNAPSKGQYFDVNIKKAGYPYRKVG